MTALSITKEQQAMIEGFKLLKQHTDYLEEVNEFEQLDIHLKDEGEFWHE